MFESKMTTRTKTGGKIRRNIILFLACFTLVAVATNSDLFAVGKVKGEGMLTALEEDGSVIIDQKGFQLSPYVTVQNHRGENVALKTLLPSRYVNFEYEYGPQGFVIIFIKEVPQ